MKCLPECFCSERASDDPTNNRTRFWWDLAAWLPLDYIALLILGDLGAGTSLLARVPLLRLLRLVRLLWSIFCPKRKECADQLLQLPRSGCTACAGSSSTWSTT